MDIIMLMAVRLGCRVVIPILWIRKSLLDSSPFCLAWFAHIYPRGLLDGTDDDNDDDDVDEKKMMVVTKGVIK
jgi:hypothetical protein